jgi:hypothetical protein
VREGSTCTGEEELIVRNSVFVGDNDYFDSTDITFLFYGEECTGLHMDSDFNLIERAKNIDCGVSGDHVLSGANDLCTEAVLTGPLSGTLFDMTLAPGSPGLESADPASCPEVDLLGESRPIDFDGDGSPVCDRGAYEQIP